MTDINAYISNLESALAGSAREAYFPIDKIERRKQNLKLAREIGYGLKDYSQKQRNSVLNTLYSRMFVRYSFDSVGVCITNKELMSEIAAVIGETA